MATALSHITAATETTVPWQGFKAGFWQRDVNVRDFIQQNYDPYEGDQSFLAPATERTKKLWNRLNLLFVEERKKGVLDISQIPPRSRPMGPVISIERAKSSLACKLRRP